MQALLFERCDGLQISGLTHINGPGSHIYVGTLCSPKGSHNTDGIDISNSIRVNIHNSIIESGKQYILDLNFH